MKNVSSLRLKVGLICMLQVCVYETKCVVQQLCSLVTQEHISCPLRIERAGLMSPPISMHYLFRCSAPQRRPAFCLCAFFPPLSISVILPFCSQKLFRSALSVYPLQMLHLLGGIHILLLMLYLSKISSG